MKRTITAVLVTLALALSVITSTTAYAGPLDDAFTAYERKDHKEAARLLTPLVAQGDDIAQFILGTMYESGRGVAQNYEEAARLYGLAAAQGNADAKTFNAIKTSSVVNAL